MIQPCSAGTGLDQDSVSRALGNAHLIFAYRLCAPSCRSDTWRAPSPKRCLLQVVSEVKEVSLGAAMGRFGAGAGHRELVQDKAALSQLTRSNSKVRAEAAAAMHVPGLLC